MGPSQCLRHWLHPRAPVSDALGSPEAPFRAVTAHTVPGSVTALEECPEGWGLPRAKAASARFPAWTVSAPQPRSICAPMGIAFPGEEGSLLVETEIATEAE